MLARPHPVFGDWCYCQPGDSQRLLDRQLSYRDAALREDPQFSGMPPEFEQWCRTSWLPANLGRDFYRKQAETHVEALAAKISRLQKEIEERAGGLLDQRDELIQQRLWLQNELDNVGAGCMISTELRDVATVLASTHRRYPDALPDLLPLFAGIV